MSMKKYFLLFLLSAGTALSAMAQIEFTGTPGAIAPATVPDLPPLPPVPTVPGSPLPSIPSVPLPDPGSEINTITDLNCSVSDYGLIDLNYLQKVRLSLVHPDVGSLTVKLVSPSGTELVLIDSLPNGGTAMTNTEFVLDSADNIALGMSPYTGRFLPLQSPPGLNNFIFEPADGEWKLRIIVKGIAGLPVGQPGTVSDWKMTFFDKSLIDTTDTTTAVKQLSLARKAVRMYPNPANVSTHIIIPADLGYPCSVSLVNMIGQTVYRSIVLGSDADIPVADLSKGIYQVNVEGRKQYHTQKLLVH